MDQRDADQLEALGRAGANIPINGIVFKQNDAGQWLPNPDFGTPTIGFQQNRAQRRRMKASAKPKARK